MATLVLSGLRQAWAKVGLVFETAPMQVVDRVEELGLVGDLSPWGRRLLTVAAHFAYGTGTGAAFRPPAQGEGRARGRGRRGLGARGPGLGGGMVQLAAADRRPQSALDPEDAEGLAPRDRPRGVRRGLGTPLLGAPQGA